MSSTEVSCLGSDKSSPSAVSVEEGVSGLASFAEEVDTFRSSCCCCCRCCCCSCSSRCCCCCSCCCCCCLLALSLWVLGAAGTFLGYCGWGISLRLTLVNVGIIPTSSSDGWMEVS